MSAGLSDNAAERLVKLLGMLGSDHDGERAAAAMKADSFVKGLGLTWRDVVMSTETDVDDLDQQQEAGEDSTDDDWWRDAARFYLQWPEDFNDWELDFLYGVLKFRKPSDKQIETIKRLYEVAVASEEASAA